MARYVYTDQSTHLTPARFTSTTTTGENFLTFPFCFPTRAAIFSMLPPCISTFASREAGAESTLSSSCLNIESVMFSKEAMMARLCRRKVEAASVLTRGYPNQTKCSKEDQLTVLHQRRARDLLQRADTLAIRSPCHYASSPPIVEHDRLHR